MFELLLNGKRIINIVHTICFDVIMVGSNLDRVNGAVPYHFISSRLI